MTLPAEKGRRYSVEEYLRLERDSIEKHEYRDGLIVPLGAMIAMAGGTYEHSLITANITGELRSALKKKPCQVLDSNMRVSVPGVIFFAYPDVSIICGPPKFDAHDPTGQSIVNPRVIVEVLSSSTEGYDRGEKFNRYRLLDSLQEYLLVTQTAPQIESYFRQADGTWLFSPFAGLQSIARVRSLEIDLPLAEVYARLEFGLESEAPQQ